ncbi:MAG TPA: TonB family protein [Candidatus Koribacter sp.]|jgi:TonB family protein
MPDSATKDSPSEIQYPASILEDVSKLVQRVQTFTGATGAAIALREDEDMVCRASRGNNAPDVGMMLSLDGTFTGLAVTGMKAVRCDDTENDSRVDPEVSRALRIKSMAVVPVLSGMRVSGVIAVFSGIGSAFSDTHMAVLKTMADGLGANIQRWLESHGLSSAAPIAHAAAVAPKPLAPPPPPPAPKIEAAPAPRIEAPKPAPAAPPAPKIETPKFAPAAAAAAPAPAKKQEQKPQGKWKPVTPKLEEEAPVAEAKPVAPDARPELKPEPKVEKSQPKSDPIVFAPSFSYETPSDEGKKNPMILGGIVAAVLVLGVGGYFMFGHSSKTPAAATTSTASQPASTPASAPATSAPAVSQPATAAVAKPDLSKAPADKNDKTGKSAEPEVITRTAPLVVAAAPVASSQPKTADVAPPSLALGAGSGPALNVPVTTSAPRLATAAPANAVVVPSRLVSRVNPAYPSAAKQYRVEGAVTLEATIAADGRVKETKVVSGPPLLRDAATNAVKLWKYSPSTVNGRPVESSVQIVLQFKMP